MSRNVMLIVMVAAVLGAGALTGVAQPRQGDVVFTVLGGSTPGMYHATWPGSVRTVKSGVGYDHR